jgi:hypothetical protein
MRILGKRGTTFAFALAMATQVSVTDAHAQSWLLRGLTIPEAVERTRPQPLELGTSPDGTVPSFEVGARSADVIAEGSLTYLNTYLSEDRTTLYTDYTFVPTRVWKGKAATNAARPGEVPSIVIRTWGGRTTIDGVPVHIYDTTQTPQRAQAEASVEASGSGRRERRRGRERNWASQWTCALAVRSRRAGAPSRASPWP